MRTIREANTSDVDFPVEAYLLAATGAVPVIASAPHESSASCSENISMGGEVVVSHLKLIVHHAATSSHWNSWCPLARICSVPSGNTMMQDVETGTSTARVKSPFVMLHSDAARP